MPKMAPIWFSVCFLVFALCMASALAIRCYECNSGNDQRCADASRLGSLYTDCSTIPGRDRCIRTRGPGALVMRACSSSASSFSEGCQINVGNNVESCLCATDYCNGADPSYNSMLLYTAVAVGAYVIGLYR